MKAAQGSRQAKEEAAVRVRQILAMVIVFESLYVALQAEMRKVRAESSIGRAQLVEQASSHLSRCLFELLTPMFMFSQQIFMNVFERIKPQPIPSVNRPPTWRLKLNQTVKLKRRKRKESEHGQSKPSRSVHS